MHDEIWRPVVGYEGYYEVSDRGGVRRVMPGQGAKVGALLAQPVHPKHGYKSVGLSVGGIAKPFQVHRLVALAFCDGRSPERNFACHKNGDPADNRAENIYWGNAKTNAGDCISHGRKARWPAHSQSVLTVKQAKYALELLYQGRSIKSVANEMGVGFGTIQRLRTRLAA